jgi:hypothetical protein
MVILSLNSILYGTWPSEYSFISIYIVPYSYFPHVLSLHILYIQLQTVKCINCIINCNIVPYSYFHNVMYLHILYIYLQTLKYINWNTVPYSYLPHFLSLHILHIHLKTLRCTWTVSTAKNHHITFHEQCTKPSIKKVVV